MFRSLAGVSLLAIMVHPVSGQQVSRDTALAAARESRAAATAGLDTLRALARTNYAMLGFTGAEQATGATLGEPLVEFYVRLDSLQAYATSKDPATLLSGGDKVLYPVMVGRETRSSIEVDRARGAWRPVTYGGQTLADAIVKQRDTLAVTEKRPANEYFLVRVPALGLLFIGARASGGLTLVPLVDDRQGRWKAGVSMPAVKIFELLVPDARASKGLPI